MGILLIFRVGWGWREKREKNREGRELDIV